ncbi:MAG: hypothetical protein M3O82_01920 [Verrucomicrobiota bacterium]|nr:hypothetical protein [Verrucomicrobiota bacterium]
MFIIPLDIALNQSLNTGMADPMLMSQSPFAALTFIAAPALLTNSSSLLVLSTINRMLRTREVMHELFARSEAGELPEPQKSLLLVQTARVETQAGMLLRALRAVYVALASFAAATLVTLLGASLAHYQGAFWFRAFAGLGLVLGCMGVGGLVIGCVRLFDATRISMTMLKDEASLIRKRQGGHPPAM